jgi:hypothetical protein
MTFALVDLYRVSPTLAIMIQYGRPARAFPRSLPRYCGRELLHQTGDFENLARTAIALIHVVIIKITLRCSIQS